MDTSKSYKFYNLPVKHEISDYKEVTAAIIKKYSRCDGLASIYNWGDPSTPGISDIDILLVFRNNAAQALPFFMRNFNFLNSKARYLVRDPFVFIGEESFKNIKYVYPDANFKLLYGKNLKINSLSSKDMFYSRAALLNDIIIRHYPRDFLEQSVSRRINARDTLLRLNSLKYSIGAIEGISKNKNSSWTQNLKMIRELRKNWFENKDFDLLALLTKDSISISMEIVEAFRLFLAKDNLVKIDSAQRATYSGIKNKSGFICNWNKEAALKDMRASIKNKKRFYSVLPIELSAQLAEYSRHQGRISDYIKNNLSNNIKYEIKYKKIIGQRALVLNSQAQLAFTLKHSDFAAFFDFGYRNKSGINNWALNLMDKARF